MPAIASPHILPAGSPVSAAAYHRRAKPKCVTKIIGSIVCVCSVSVIAVVIMESL